MEYDQQYADVIVEELFESPAHFNIFLDAYETNNGIFHKKEKVFVQLLRNVNVFLQDSETRVKGLIVLDRILKDCSQEQLNEFYSGWLQIIHKILIHGREGEVSAASAVITQLVHIISRYPDHMKQALIGSVPVIVNTLIAPPHKNVVHHLQVISCFLKLFRGPCGPLRGKIQNYVLQHFDSDVTAIRELCARCVSLIPTSGGAGSQGLNHSQAWLQMCKKVLQSIRMSWKDYLEAFLIDRARIQEDEMDLGLPEIDGNVHTFYVKVKNRLQTLLLCLQELISLEVDMTINIPLDTILEEICIILTFGPPVKGAPNLDRLLALSVLSGIQISALRVIDVLIKTCSSNLLPFCDIINKSMVQLLAQTSPKNKMAVRSVPYSQLRVQVYSVLLTWLAVEGAASCIEDVSEQLIPLLLADVLQPTLVDDKTPNDYKLMDGAGSKHGRKKKRMRLTVDSVTSSGPTYICDVRLACLAAKVCRSLVLSSGELLASPLHIALTEAILPALARHQTQSDASLWDPALRRQVYKVLGALVTNPNPLLPPALQPAISLLQAGIRDPNIQVSQSCRNILAVCQTIIHPRVPSIDLPMTAQQIQPMNELMEEPEEPEPTEFSQDDEERYYEEEYGEVGGENIEESMDYSRHLEEDFEDEDVDEEEDMDEDSEYSDEDPYDDLPPADQYEEEDEEQEDRLYKQVQKEPAAAETTQMDSDIEVIDLSPDSSPIRRSKSSGAPALTITEMSAEVPLIAVMTSEEAAAAYHNEAEMTTLEVYQEGGDVTAHIELAYQEPAADDSMIASSTAAIFDSTADRESLLDTTAESIETTGIEAVSNNEVEQSTEPEEPQVSGDVSVDVSGDVSVDVSDEVSGEKVEPASDKLPEQLEPVTTSVDEDALAAVLLQSPKQKEEVPEEIEEMLKSFVPASPDPE